MENELLNKLFAHLSLLLYLGVLTCMLLYMRRMVKNRVVKVIYVAFVFWFIIAAKDITYFFGNIWYDDNVANVLMTMDLWPIPILTSILLYVLQPQWLTAWRLGAICLPFFGFTLLSIVTKGDSLVFLINQIYAFVFATLFSVITFLLTFRYEKYIEANYSNKESFSVRWIRYSIGILYALCSILMVISINSTWLGDGIFYLVSTLFSIVLFYFTLNHKNIIMPNYMHSIKSIFSSNVDDIPTEEDSLSMSKSYAEIEKRLEKAIREDKVYLNAQLSLSDLAVLIGTNRTYLSRYINNYKSTPFINYINDIRLDEAQYLLDNNSEHLSISEISERSGFASYSTFRRVYKQRYGYAPSLHTQNRE